MFNSVQGIFDRRSTTAERTSSFADYQAISRIPNLDGLRGLAILLVLFHHTPAVSIPWLAQLQEHGKHGVSLFFVISGYIVTTLLLREWQRRGRIDTRGFLIRRMLRLCPLYFAVLLLESFLVFGLEVYSPQNQQLFADKLPCYLLYCSNWLETSGQGPFFVAWSLAAEEQFYLLLAALLIVVKPPLLPWIFGAMLLLKIMLVLVWPRVDLASLPWRVLLSYSEAIVIGVLLAIVLDRAKGFRKFAGTLGSATAASLIIMVFFGLLFVVDLQHKSSVSALGLYLLCALLVGSCAVQAALPALGRGLLPWLGSLSYGIYLFHMPVLSAVKKLTEQPLPVLLFSLLLLLPIAWISFTFFENPIRRIYTGQSR
jgi:peptidoglycan/LPS O-acetylase OafA/YrhL